MYGTHHLIAVLLTTAVAPAAIAQTGSVAQPAINDAMLTPPPDAPRQVASWDEAIALIRAHSPDYATSREQVHRAEAAQRNILAGELPVINGTASYVHQFFQTTIPISDTLKPTTPPADTFAVGASLNWTVINPRALYGLGTASRNLDAAKLSDSDARKNIAINVVAAMLATLATSRVSELDRVGLRSALERLQLTQARFQFGQGTGLDVDRAQQDVAAARSLVINADESTQQSREQLGAALGSTTQLSAAPSLDLESFEAAVARTCHLNDEIEARPDVSAARLRVEVAERAVTDAELQIAPSLSLTSNANYANQAVLAPLGTWSVGALITVPFYDGGLRYGARRDALALAEQARQTLETTRINAVVMSTRTQREVTVLKASRDQALEQRNIARRVDERTRDAYSRGQGTSLDLVISAQSLRQAETNLAILDFQVAQARANAVLANAECVY